MCKTTWDWNVLHGQTGNCVIVRVRNAAESLPETVVRYGRTIITRYPTGRVWPATVVDEFRVVILGVANAGVTKRNALRTRARVFRDGQTNVRGRVFKKT